MKKLTLIAVLALAALSLPVSATTVAFSAGIGASVRDVVLADGSTAVGQSGPDLVLAGVFSNEGSFTYNPALSVLANVNSMVSDGFQPFGFVPTSDGGTYSNGTWTPESTGTNYTLQTNYNSGTGLTQVSGSIIDNTTNASFFNGSQIYLVIFNGTTVSTSTQMGIFTGAQISPAQTWAFPTNTQGTGGDSVTYGTSTSNNNVSAVAGSVKSSPNQLELAPTPEPSTLAALFGATGFLAMLRRRRTA